MNHYRIFFEKGRYHKRQAEAVDVYNTTAELANIEAKKYLLSKGLKMFKRTNTTLVQKNVNIQIPVELPKATVKLLKVVTDQHKSTVQNERYTVQVEVTLPGKKPMDFTTQYILSEEEIKERFGLTKEQFKQVAKKLPIFSDEQKRFYDLHG
jgi:hypothetical protein